MSAGFAFSWVASILLVATGSGVPLGMPPAPPDPAVFRAAPDECLWFFSWAGTADPDPNSSNHTEQLIAEAEVQRMLNELETQLVAAFRRGAPPTEAGRTAAELGPELIKTLLTRPGAVFVTSAGVGLNGPVATGGAIFNVGDQGKQVEKALTTLERLTMGQESTPREEGGWRRVGLPPQAPPVEWAVKGEYLIVGINTGSAEEIAERVKGKETAEWLQELREGAAIKRVSTVNYLNVKTIAEMAAPALGFGRGRTILDTAGAGNIKHYGSVSGLDDQGAVTRTLLALEGEPKGFLAVAAGEPLSAEDLAPIPADATVAVAARIDPRVFLNTVFEVAQAVDPQQAKRLRIQIDRSKDELGFDWEKDILESVGDLWCVYDSPSESGLLIGATAVASIRNREGLLRANARMVDLIRAEGQKDRERNRQRPRFVTVKDFEVDGQQVFFLNFVGDDVPFAPAWCITKDRLVVGLYPQSIKSYLAHQTDAKILSSRPEVASLLKAKNPPFAIAYYDTRRIAELVYPGLQMLANILCSEAQREGVAIDVSLLPQLETFTRHLSSGTVAVALTDRGIQLESKAVLPISAAPATLLVPMMGFARAQVIQIPDTPAGLAPPPETRADFDRDVMDSLNNLKQIGLALHNYHEVHKSLPPAFSLGKDDKPLLSWRVAILPFLDGEAARLHREFKLDEPWDSPHNKKLIERMPRVYALPGAEKLESGKTAYVAVRGKHTILSGSEPRSIADVTDGTSKTIVVVEGSNELSVIWTKPADFEFDPQNPADRLLGRREDGFLALFMDGSARMIKRTAAAETLRRLFNRDDGQIVDRDDF